MEKHLALINKSDKRVKNVIIVDDINDEIIAIYSNETIQAVEVKDKQIVYVNGIWDGKTFKQPDLDYLIEIGVYPSKEKLAEIKKLEDEIASNLLTDSNDLG